MIEYKDALAAIWARSAYDRGYVANPFAGDDVAALGLRRTAALLDWLDRPQDRLRILHVAGSKGKGSTCAFASSMLTAAGLRTGRYTSPHLHSFRERFAVDGRDIDEFTFAALTERAIDGARAIESSMPGLGEVTAFELATAMAFDWFARSGCTHAVVEVGMGGTLDATNVVDPVASVITTLDYEHTRVLGSTIAEIAANKTGIIKHGRPVATAALPPEAVAVVKRVAAKRTSPWLSANRDWRWRGDWREFSTTGPWGELTNLRAGLVGNHQVDNACLAIAGVWLLLGAELTEAIVRVGLADARWPGRFEIVRMEPRPLVLDGAHTPASATALSQAFASEFPGSRCTIVLAVLRDKDPVAIADALSPVAAEYIAVTAPGPRGLPAGDLHDRLFEAGLRAQRADSIRLALDAAANQPILVTGSLATVAAAREALGLAISDPISFV